MRETRLPSSDDKAVQVRHEQCALTAFLEKNRKCHRCLVRVARVLRAVLEHGQTERTLFPRQWKRKRNDRKQGSMGRADVGLHLT